MSNVPNKHVQAYHIRQAYVEVLKRGYLISVESVKDNTFLIAVSPDGTVLSPRHKFIVRPQDE